MKEDLLGQRLSEYATSKTVYKTSCCGTALLFTASAAAGLGAIICPPPAEAAIQYSGIKNIVMGTEVDPILHNIDLDGDGNGDFEFYFARRHITYSMSSQRIKLEEMGLGINFVPENSIILRHDDSGTYYAPLRLPANYTVQDHLETVNRWESGGGDFALAGKMNVYFKDFSNGALLEESDFIGHFIGKKGYLGVRFQISGETHYGWIQFAADEDLRNGRIIDWAYEDQADKPIRAGEGRFSWNLVMPAIINGAGR